MSYDMVSEKHQSLPLLYCYHMNHLQCRKGDPEYNGLILVTTNFPL